MRRGISNHARNCFPFGFTGGFRSASIAFRLAKPLYCSPPAYHWSMLNNTGLIRTKDLAGIQYVGLDGVSASCYSAVKRLIQFGDRIERARLLTCQGRHALLLTVTSEDLVVAKAGFTSGYAGEGPRTLAEVLRLLIELKVDVDECDVTEAILERVAASALTTKDVETIKRASSVRPTRVYDYIHAVYEFGQERPSIWDSFPPAMPWAIIDRRIIDLALQIMDQPDESLMRGFRRLEDCIRERTGNDEHGTKLFTKAFTDRDAKLTWNVRDQSEIGARAQLFSSAFMAYRNPRAHREINDALDSSLIEFLMLNHLFVLERQAIDRTSPSA
jgi:hypothetical protein